MRISNNFKKIIINQKLLFFLINIFLLSNCTKEAQIKIFSPAEINTLKIKNVAVGKFEIGQISLRYKTERNGVWKNYDVFLEKSHLESISRSIRSRVVNLLTSTPYFKVVFIDEFEKIETDEELKELISTSGYEIEKIDAIINGKIWLDIEKTDGVDISKEELVYFRPANRKKNIGLNLLVDQIVWWPYKSLNGTLGLEIKMIRANPSEIVANTFESRTFSQRIGGKSRESIKKIGKKFFPPIKSYNSIEAIENSDEVLPAFDQLVADLAISIASRFVKRVSVTEKIVSYPIADGTSENSKILIQAGAFDLAIELLQKATEKNPHPNDLYNLGLCFEAIGDYGLARTTYKEAWQARPENTTFAKGLGRIEKLLRERPKLQKQLKSR